MLLSKLVARNSILMTFKVCYLQNAPSIIEHLSDHFINYKFELKWRWINLKLKYFSILFIVVGLLSACNNSIEPKEYLGEIYSVALDAIMEQDKALSSDIEFIAIDMSNFKDVDESDKEEILSYFKEKYKVDVMDATLNQITEKGLYNSETLVLDGVLLQIKNVDFKSNSNIFFEGSKYRSGDGAAGGECEIHLKDNKWEVKEVKETWKS